MASSEDGDLPSNRVVGISKLARVLHGFARRLRGFAPLSFVIV